MARPSKFKEEFIPQAEKLCKLGATDMEVADFFEVDVRTLYRWKGENAEFCQSEWSAACTPVPMGTNTTRWTFAW